MAELSNVSAECSVLAHCILNNDVTNDIIISLPSDEYFTKDGNKAVYNVIRELSESNSAFDANSIKELLILKLYDKDNVERLLNKIMEFATKEDVIHENINILNTLYHRRLILKCLDDIKNDIENKEIDDMLMYNDIIRESLLSSGTSLKDESLASVRPTEGDGHCLAKTILLDPNMMRMRKNDICVIAARPAAGKTLYMIQLLWSQACQGKNVALFSLEMTKSEVIDRIIRMTMGSDTQEEIQAAYKNFHLKYNEVLHRFNIYDNIFDLDSILMKLTSLKSGFNLNLYAIDYIGLVNVKGATNAASEVFRIKKASRSFKMFTQQNLIPGIVVSQLNRLCENRDDKRPLLSDLQQSGQIEQDASVVLMLYRDELYHSKRPDGSSTKGDCEVLSRKCRSGKIGTFPLFFNEGARFEKARPEQKQERLKSVKKAHAKSVLERFK